MDGDMTAALEYLLMWMLIGAVDRIDRTAATADTREFIRCGMRVWPLFGAFTPAPAGWR